MNKNQKKVVVLLFILYIVIISYIAGQALHAFTYAQLITTKLDTKYIPLNDIIVTDTGKPAGTIISINHNDGMLTVQCSIRKPFAAGQQSYFSIQQKHYNGYELIIHNTIEPESQRENKHIFIPCTDSLTKNK